VGACFVNTDLTIGRARILKHLKHRWAVEVMFRVLKEQFGLGDCRCRGAKSLSRWVELVLLAYAIAGLTRWGRQLLQQKTTWFEACCHWGNRLICPVEQTRIGLDTLTRLISWTLKSASSPLPQEDHRFMKDLCISQLFLQQGPQYRSRGQRRVSHHQTNQWNRDCQANKPFAKMV